MSAAISQWRSLTHLATLMVGLITKLGFGTIEMLEAKVRMREERSDELQTLTFALVIRLRW